MIKCEFCNKSYNRQGHLDKHILKCVKNPNSTNIIKCNMCEQKFKRLSDLQRHYCIKTSSKKCLFCNREYNKNKFLESHMKVCKIYTNNTNNIINNTTNNNTTNNNTTNIGSVNNTYNITILPYNQRDMSHISVEALKLIMKNPVTCMPKLLNAIHFNEDVPQNHNVYVSDISRNKMMVYEDSEWKILDAKEEIKHYEGFKYCLENDVFDKILTISEPERTKVRNLYNNYEYTKDCEETTRKIENNMMKTMYNGKSVVLDTRRRIKNST